VKQKIFLSAVFANKFFSLEADTLKSYNTKGIQREVQLLLNLDSG